MIIDGIKEQFKIIFDKDISNWSKVLKLTLIAGYILTFTSLQKY